MECDTTTLPAYWASALINGDFSGLDDDEAARCRAAIGQLAADGWRIVDTARDEDSEQRFTWHYQLYDPGADCSGGEVLGYVILRPKRAP